MWKTLRRDLKDRFDEMETRRQNRKERKPTRRVREYFWTFLPEECKLLLPHLTKTEAWTKLPITTKQGEFKNVRLNLDGMWVTDLYLAEDGNVYCPNGESAWVKGVLVYYVELVHLEWLSFDELIRIWTRIYELRYDIATAEKQLAAIQ